MKISTRLPDPREGNLIKEGRHYFNHISLSDHDGLAAQLEVTLKLCPVVDQTGLEGYYDISLDWGPGDHLDLETMNGALHELGLELVPGRASAEMWLVEKVK